MEHTSPNITFMLQYTEANSGYVDYMNREEAVRIDEELSLETHRQSVEDLTEAQLLKIQSAVPETSLNFREYIDYMNRSFATEKQTEDLTAVFTENADYLQRQKLTELKNNLEQAYQNGSLLWQGVVSFDNHFLAQQGLYDEATGQVDQKAIKTVMREMMPTLIQKEGLSDSAFWWGNIHLNTDNIHVHFGLSEIESQREKIFYRPRGKMEYKGNFSQKTIQRFKSGIFHGLLKEETRSNLIRKEQILANLKTNLIDTVYREGQIRSSAEKNFLEQAYNHLPQNKKWRYGSNAKDFAVSKFFLDKYLDSYFMNEGKELYQDFIQETREFLRSYEGAYSAEKNQAYEKIRHADGRTIRTLAHSKGYNLEAILARRELELRERLANKILRTFKDAAPQISEGQVESNLNKFSKHNQKLILQQLPEAYLLRSLNSWERMGYFPEKGVQPIQIYKPVYAAYDENGKGIGKPSFVSSYVYDISQMKENIQAKKIGLKHLSLLSSAELAELVEVAKQKENKTDKECQELGIFRYALKLSVLEERRKALLVSQKLLEQIRPLKSDQPFIDFKRKAFAQELELIQLQLKPNFKLSKAEMETKETLQKKFEDSISFPISKATVEAIQPSIRQLGAEYRLVENIQDENILTLLKGQTTSKKAYLEELNTKMSIFGIKHSIYDTNVKIEQTTDEAVIKGFKRANAQRFSQLKELYGRLQGEKVQNQNQINQVVASQIKQQKQLRRTSLQGSQGKLEVNTDFLRQISSSLKAAKSGDKKALMERARSDEREEQEERKNASIL